MIALEAPETLGPKSKAITLRGWCNAQRRPKFVEVRISNYQVRTAITAARDIDLRYPEWKAVRFKCEVDFSRIYRSGKAHYSQGLFAVSVAVESELEQRIFEYIVCQDWVDLVFDGPVKPVAKRRTPDHLISRVAGLDMSFYPSGRMVAGKMRTLLAEYGRSLDDFENILDFGCGCGRVLLALHDERVRAKLHGCDVDKEAIQWCRENFALAATFDANDALPPTRYADSSFDLVYGISVFTHLPENYQDAWLAELRRILKPGGLLLTTIHGPYFSSLQPQDLQIEIAAKGFVYVDRTKENWPSYLGAKTDGLPDYYRLSYHTFGYVRRHWSRYLEILDIKEEGLNRLQDAVVCWKPAKGEFAPRATGIVHDRSRVEKPWAVLPTVRQFRLHVSMPPEGHTGRFRKLQGSPTFNLEALQSVSEPFHHQGRVITLSARDPLTLSGWAVDGTAGQVASGVEIVIDGIAYQAVYGDHRPDVAEHFHISAYGKSGFTFSFPTERLASGRHTVTVRVITADRRGYCESAQICFRVDGAESPKRVISIKLIRDWLDRL